MKYALIALALLPSLAQASVTSRVLETETKEVVLAQPLQYDLRCEPGRGGHRFPTASALILNNLDIFTDTTLHHLVYSDYPNLGDNCAELVERFTSQLPAKLVVTRTKTETCYDQGSYVRKVVTQLLSGEVAGFKMGTGNELISEDEIQGGSCQ